MRADTHVPTGEADLNRMQIFLFCTMRAATHVPTGEADLKRMQIFLFAQYVLTRALCI